MFEPSFECQLVARLKRDSYVFTTKYQELLDDVSNDDVTDTSDKSHALHVSHACFHLNHVPRPASLVHTPSRKGVQAFYIANKSN